MLGFNPSVQREFPRFTTSWYRMSELQRVTLCDRVFANHRITPSSLHHELEALIHRYSGASSSTDHHQQNHETNRDDNNYFDNPTSCFLQQQNTTTSPNKNESDDNDCPEDIDDEQKSSNSSSSSSEEESPPTLEDTIASRGREFLNEHRFFPSFSDDIQETTKMHLETQYTNRLQCECYEHWFDIVDILVGLTVMLQEKQLRALIHHASSSNNGNNKNKNNKNNIDDVAASYIAPLYRSQCTLELVERWRSLLCIHQRQVHEEDIPARL